MKNKSGKLVLLVVAIIWGTGFVASALALEYYTPVQILALRFTIAFVISFILFRNKLKSISKRKVMKASLIGLFLFLAFYFQTVGLQYTTASKNAFLTATNIIIVPFLSFVIFKDKIKSKNILGAIVTLIGIGFLSVEAGGFTGINKGDLLTLVCAVFFALQIFYTDHVVKDIDAEVILVIQMGVAMVLSWFAVVFTKSYVMPFTFEALQSILYLGIASTLIAFGLQTWAQKHTNSTEAAVLLSTEAFFGMIASIIILKEAMTIQLLIGAVLIFTGVIIVEVIK